MSGHSLRAPEGKGLYHAQDERLQGRGFKVDVQNEGRPGELRLSSRRVGAGVKPRR